MRGATRQPEKHGRHPAHFNPRTPCGVRPSDLIRPTSIKEYFNPRTPCGVRPGCWHIPDRVFYFNPRTPCGVRLDLIVNACRIRRISIHAPHAGCDFRIEFFKLFRVISIHAPHAGCDSMVKIFRFYRRFQRHFREAENLPCTYRGFSQFFLLLASPSRYRIIVSLGS